MSPLIHILWPGGNTTALVEGYIPYEERASIAGKIVRQCPDVEQVGFISSPRNPAADVHLEMLGGEFCGNATRSAAFFWARKTGRKSLLIETSGLTNLVPAECTDSSASIHFPSSMIVGIREIDRGTIVDMHGITHLIIRSSTPSVDEIHRILDPYKDLPAVGAIFTTGNEELVVIDPYVFFRQTDIPVLIHETGCASGSIAATAALAQKTNNTKSLRVRQPSGETYAVTVRGSGNQYSEIYLDGHVRLLRTLKGSALSEEK